MQSALSSIWTLFTVPISYDDNQYTTGTFIFRRIYDVFGEACFRQKKNVWKWAEHSFATLILRERKSLGHSGR